MQNEVPIVSELPRFAREGRELPPPASPPPALAGPTTPQIDTLATLVLSPLLTTPIPFLLVKVCALMACHLYPKLCTWDLVTTRTPVTDFFPLGVRLCSKEKKKEFSGVLECQLL